MIETAYFVTYINGTIITIKYENYTLIRVYAMINIQTSGNLCVIFWPRFKSIKPAVWKVIMYNDVTSCVIFI